MIIYSKNQAKKEITELVKEFEKNIDSFKGKNYKEAQVENDFIRPLFQFLNWNVSNRGLEPERQVFLLQVTNKTGNEKNKRPDYLLRVPDNVTKSMKSVFFMEAKKPIYDLKTNTSYIRQVYQYAWSTLNSSDNPNNQVRLAVLTDFEEFRFFDCQDATPLKQNRVESFNKNIIKDWNYKDYVEKFDELWDLFEYNNVVNGSLEKWHLTSKQLADNRITPDKQFLEDLRDWRLTIARSMYKNDKSLDDYRLTKATLLYINRLIFIKMLADRNIEDDYLTNILNKLNQSKKSELKLYELCKDIFQRLDHIYNGSIFVYDNITDEIIIDNSILKNIFTALKPENSIYTLAAMPVEIIGNVYELFIAEQIVKKGTGIAIVPKYDEKKAGGVYYTPRYIVEYIVDNTLGKKLDECKTPDEVSKLKVLDPACGSGSFLIVAYQKLLDWHKKYYFDELMKWTKKGNIEKFTSKSEHKVRVINDVDTNFYSIHLSHKLKSDILTNNIFGVDIDEQAVLVTKFSLSIKALEDSTHDEIIEDNTLFKIPAIPILENNIKCGNSVIGSDFYLDNRPSLFNEKEKRKINTFDWEKEFPDVFKSNGKDAVSTKIKKIDNHLNAAVNYLEGAIYHTEKVGEYVNEIIKSKVKEKTIEYNAISEGGFDVIVGNPPYVKYENLNVNTIPYLKNKYLTAKSFFDIYQIFIEKSISLLNFSGNHGFIIPNLFLKGMNYKLSRKLYLERTVIKSITNFGDGVFINVKMPTCIIISTKNNIKNYSVEFIENEGNVNKELVNITNFYKNDFCFTKVDFVEKLQDKSIILADISKITRGLEIGKNLRINTAANFKEILFGDNLDRYLIKSFSKIDKTTFKEFQKNNDIFQYPKILIRETGSSITASYDGSGLITNRSLYCIRLKSNKYKLLYILAILNSKLIQYYYSKRFKAETKIFPKIRVSQVNQLPIRNIDFSNKTEKAMHDKLVELVEQMLENQKYQHEAKGDSDKRMYKNICDTIDKQIDRIVYKLYDLTEEEIAIVEA